MFIIYQSSSMSINIIIQEVMPTNYLMPRKEVDIQRLVYCAGMNGKITTLNNSSAEQCHGLLTGILGVGGRRTIDKRKKLGNEECCLARACLKVLQDYK